MTTPQNPFDGMGLPEEFHKMLQSMQLDPSALANMRFDPSDGPVNWPLARKIALGATTGRDATPDEQTQWQTANDLAAHWLDATALPPGSAAAAPQLSSRTAWIDTALVALRPLLDPIAHAQTEALTSHLQVDIDIEALPPELSAMLPPQALEMLQSIDPSTLFAGVGAQLAALNAGRILAELASKILHQHELGIPTGPTDAPAFLPENIDTAFEGWDIPPLDVAIAIALMDQALSRIYSGLTWIMPTLTRLVADYAGRTELDLAGIERSVADVMGDVDFDDPDSMQQAFDQASTIRIEPTGPQREVLRSIHTLVGLVQAWARHEAAGAAADHLPTWPQIDEVLRRRNGTGESGDGLLTDLLGLALRPASNACCDSFVAYVARVRGPRGLAEALAHPENMPSWDELDDPESWIVRLEASLAIPDDARELFDDE